MADHNRAVSTMAPLNLPAACKPYPSDLRSLEECCDVPLLFNNDQYAACEHMCSHDNDTSLECPVKCLLKFNNIMKNSAINKTAIEAYFDQNGNDPNWKPITKFAMESCQFVIDPKVNLKKIFEDFEDCMNIKFEEHCIHFKDSKGCDKVEEFMFKCQNFKHNCSVWPFWFVKLPETCCDGRPELFDSNLDIKANIYCKKQDLLSRGEQLRCLTNFMLNETKIRTNEKWNFNVASKRLTENSKNGSKWKTAIEKTMETCQKQVQGLITVFLFNCFIKRFCIQDDEKDGKDASHVNFWFYECVKASFGDFCPEYAVKRNECRRVAAYKKACPESVPPRKLYMDNETL